MAPAVRRGARPRSRLPCSRVPTPILFISHVVDWGGAETVLADLLGALDRSRLLPHLACPGDGPLPRSARERGVPVHGLPIGGHSAWQKLRCLPRAAHGLRRLAAATGARLLYANTMIAGYAGVLAQGRTLPCLWHLHTAAPSRLAAFALRRAAAVVAPSRAGALAVAPSLAHSGRLHVVPNGVSDAFFTARGSGLRAALRIPDQTPLAGIVGRLDPHKGHEVLLRAFAGPAVPPDAHLAVVGAEALAGSLPRVRGFEDRLRALAAELGLAGRVHFLGHRDDVAGVLTQLDAVAVPSTAPESAPRAIAEAQAAGRAVVASRIGGVPELVEHGTTGLLVPPGDPAALAAALGSVLRDGALRGRLGAAANAHARERYALASFAGAIAAIIERTIAHQG